MFLYFFDSINEEKKIVRRKKKNLSKKPKKYTTVSLHLFVDPAQLVQFPVN